VFLILIAKGRAKTHHSTRRKGKGKGGKRGSKFVVSALRRKLALNPHALLPGARRPPSARASSSSPSSPSSERDANSGTTCTHLVIIIIIIVI